MELPFLFYFAHNSQLQTKPKQISLLLETICYLWLLKPVMKPVACWSLLKPAWATIYNDFYTNYTNKNFSVQMWFRVIGEFTIGGWSEFPACRAPERKDN